MKPIELLINTNLLSWNTLFHGWMNGWVARIDIIRFAITLLVEKKDNDNEVIALIASGDSLSDDDLLELVSSQMITADESVEIDKWRLAFLLCIAESDASEQEQIDELQDVYSEFGYPEDMSSCSIYAQDGVDPLEAMKKVVKELKEAIGITGAT
jgi:hypothetical protein